MLHVDDVAVMVASLLHTTIRADLIFKNGPVAVLVLLRSVENQVLDRTALVFFHASDLR